MNKLKQLITHHPEFDDFGDCFRTCVAMILDKSCPSEVPHFYNFKADKDKLVEANKAIDRYFESQGLVNIHISMTGSISFQQLMDHTKKNYSGLHFIVTVRLARGEGNHCIVCQNGQVIADPHYATQYDYEPCLDLDGGAAWGVDLIVARPSNVTPLGWRCTSYKYPPINVWVNVKWQDYDGDEILSCQKYGSKKEIAEEIFMTEEDFEWTPVPI